MAQQMISDFVMVNKMDMQRWML
jgi:hypothetical protein